MKYQYSLEVIEDIWMAPQLGINPIERQWITAQTNTGFERLDQLLDSWHKRLPAAILKQESVSRLNDLVKKEESTKVEKINVTSIEALDPSKIPEELLRMPACGKVSRKEMQAAAEDMLKETLQ